MTVYLVRSEGRVTFQARAESAGVLGDVTIELEPGQSVFGKSYEEWASLPDGPYRVD